ncbi:IS110 family RNA-guided transposase [Confluentibacter flavum]|uniref:IS110 family transposase n=1 Tax=Confluentibacter flavum TaxID=1909700 RepID=A0A2N3HM18_9FLAO|nr:IS110 family transposase [Confluentibacter flavum]PKQ46020.1 IS110 family transposase [Confluentibacter flavum]
MKNIFIGIDISSKTLDLCIKKDGQVAYSTIGNTIKECDKFFKKYAAIKDAAIYVAMENTGRYNYNLYEALEGFSFLVYVINPIHIKKSLGLVRGKNDRIDAERITLFIEKNHMDLPQWKPSTESIKQLKVLQAERKYRVKIKSGLLRQRSDYKVMNANGMDKELLKLNESLIRNIDAQISKIEAKIQFIIGNDERLREQVNRIRTIPGVGKVLAWMVLSKTEGFTKIDNPRRMACFAGVVPFEHQSGTSLKYRPRVSIFADKELKKVLHLAAMSAIRLENDLRVYYLRKIEEGKNKMSILNAIRNKIIHRIFALIKNQTFYKNDLVVS